MAIHITSNTRSLCVRSTSREQLRSIIKYELEHQGPDADLNFIDTSLITDMSELFYGLGNAIRNIKIDEWDVSNVKDMNGMFEGCNMFTGSGLGNWDVSNVTNMSNMFEGGASFVGIGLENWDTSNVIHVSCMFHGATSFNGILSTWNTKNVVDMYKMFEGAESFTGTGIGSWNVSNVIDMRWMFCGATSFVGVGLENWDISNVKQMDAIFDNTKLDVYTVFYKQIPTMPY